MSVKLIILSICSIVAGAGFIFVGIYFLSQKYINKLNEASLDKEIQKKNFIRAKGSGYISLGLGAFTLLLGILILFFPEIAAPLALSYMIVLVLCFTALVFIFK